MTGAFSGWPMHRRTVPTEEAPIAIRSWFGQPEIAESPLKQAFQFRIPNSTFCYIEQKTTVAPLADHPD